jgi:hypothetical protein
MEYYDFLRLHTVVEDLCERNCQAAIDFIAFFHDDKALISARNAASNHKTIVGSNFG